jgi:hypothetical protein
VAEFGEVAADVTADDPGGTGDEDGERLLIHAGAGGVNVGLVKDPLSLPLAQRSGGLIRVVELAAAGGCFPSAALSFGRVIGTGRRVPRRLRLARLISLSAATGWPIMMAMVAGEAGDGSLGRWRQTSA